MYTFWNDNMPNVNTGYGRFSASIAFLEIFFNLYVRNYMTSSNFYKMCVKEKVTEICKHMYGYLNIFFNTIYISQCIHGIQ